MSIKVKSGENQNQKDGADEFYFEFRHALKLLKGGNTQIIELLYNKKWEILSREWELVIKNRDNLIDSERLFNSLRGYVGNELRLALGERPGKVGVKRHSQIEEFGYSPKNAVQAIRLMWAGSIFFEKGYFPVNIKDEDSNLAAKLFEIKTNPFKFWKEEIKENILFWEKRLIYNFENRTQDKKFNDKLADHICLEIYYHLIHKEYLESFGK